MRKTASAFGIGKSTVSTIVGQVAKEISTYLPPKYIWLDLKRSSRNGSAILQKAWVSIRFTHVLTCIPIAIKRPKINSSSDFINRKGNYTLNCQLTADYFY